MSKCDTLPPQPRLGRKPKIKTFDEADLALRELGWISHRRTQVDTETEQAIARLKQAATNQLVVDGEPLSGRELALRTALEQFATDHRAEIDTATSRSRKLRHGTIGFKDRPARVEYLDGHDPKSVLARMSDGLPAKILAFLKRLGLCPWLRLKVELDVSAIGQACKAGQLTTDQLAEQGLTYQAGEAIVVEPAKHLVETQ